MSQFSICSAAVLVLTLINLSFANNLLSFEAVKRFEYKLSFKGPYLVLNDGTVPFWDHFGSSIASDESVRITPSLKSKKGSIWSKDHVTFDHWEAEITFKIFGRGRLGADGLAIWYTKERAEEGPVFGNRDKWTGLGVFFDSYDNDNQNNNPYIMAMHNDGTQEYNHQGDGSNQILAGCLRDFRNKPFPLKLKIEYYKKTLTLLYHNGLSQTDDFELCGRVEEIELPKNGYFGISAATGGLADDHDVLSFVTHSLSPPTQDGVPPSLPEGEKEKFEKEYQDFRDKLEKAREDYKKDHPDAHLGGEIDEDKVYEAQEARELRQIFEGQSEIHRIIKSTLGKLDEIVGRQERQLSLLTQISHKSPPQPGAPQIQGEQLQKRDVEQLANSQHSISQDVKNLRNLINSLEHKIDNLPQTRNNDPQPFKELSDNFNVRMNNLELIISSNNNPSSNSSCLSISYFLFFLFLHLILLISYFVYKAKKEAAAKKFF